MPDCAQPTLTHPSLRHPLETITLKQPPALPIIPRDSDKERPSSWHLILFQVEYAGIKECVRAKVPVLLLRTGLRVRSEAPRLPGGAQNDLTVHSPLPGPSCPLGLLIHQHNSNHGLQFSGSYRGPGLRPACFILWDPRQQPHKLGFIVRPTLQRKKLRLRQVKAIARGASRLQPGCGDSRRPHTDPPCHPARAGSWVAGGG